MSLIESRPDLCLKLVRTRTRTPIQPKHGRPKLFVIGWKFSIIETLSGDEVDTGDDFAVVKQTFDRVCADLERDLKETDRLLGEMEKWR